jgi:Cu-Zn family superoxide dismutase
VEADKEEDMTRGAIAALGIAAVGIVAGTALPAMANGGRTVRAAGPVVAYRSVSPNPLAGVHGTVQAVTTASGGTRVTLHLRGFANDQVARTFGVHVHTGPCADGTSAGPHYTHPGPAPTLEEREIWLDFTVNTGGLGHAKASRDWLIEPGAAQSIVIHAEPTAPSGAAGTRQGCIGVAF